jgi:hypothetical protein
MIYATLHASQLLRAGVSPKVISERLGHSKVGFTLDIYGHILPGMEEEAAQKVDSGLRAALEKYAERSGSVCWISKGLANCLSGPLARSRSRSQNCL